MGKRNEIDLSSLSSFEEAPAREFDDLLAELTVNSRPVIHFLTSVAADNSAHVNAISFVLEWRIYHSSSDKRLPLLYLLDSIVKNVGYAYNSRIAENIVETFTNAYEFSSLELRQVMKTLLNTWFGLFETSICDAILVRLNEMDKAGVKAGLVYVNPRALRKPGGLKQIQQRKILEQKLRVSRAKQKTDAKAIRGDDSNPNVKVGDVDASDLSLSIDGLDYNNVEKQTESLVKEIAEGLLKKEQPSEEKITKLKRLVNYQLKRAKDDMTVEGLNALVVMIRQLEGDKTSEEPSQTLATSSEDGPAEQSEQSKQISQLDEKDGRQSTSPDSRAIGTATDNVSKNSGGLRVGEGGEQARSQIAAEHQAIGTGYGLGRGQSEGVPASHQGSSIDTAQIASLLSQSVTGGTQISPSSSRTVAQSGSHNQLGGIQPLSAVDADRLGTLSALASSAGVTPETLIQLLEMTQGQPQIPPLQAQPVGIQQSVPVQQQPSPASTDSLVSLLQKQLSSLLDPSAQNAADLMAMMQGSTQYVVPTNAGNPAPTVVKADQSGALWGQAPSTAQHPVAPQAAQYSATGGFPFVNLQAQMPFSTEPSAALTENGTAKNEVRTDAPASSKRKESRRERAKGSSTGKRHGKKSGKGRNRNWSRYRRETHADADEGAEDPEGWLAALQEQQEQLGDEEDGEIIEEGEVE
eukprot:CAMPEP_0113955046 /NCGR_PEP_ID=MMETSP0011_2-20120614/1034_1 /TAXON_ID=101924 /ORGANISM="Rhodosorus marinus" /LENGTH=691 /DNA_ID=CAMNT_0000964529 /DNA_START=429 /DNA_END=2504 /DNA_ORIENTATION=- /assembly_acc=CAM_ASM_000156